MVRSKTAALVDYSQSAVVSIFEKCSKEGRVVTWIQGPPRGTDETGEGIPARVVIALCLMSVCVCVLTHLLSNWSELIFVSMLLVETAISIAPSVLGLDLNRLSWFLLSSLLIGPSHPGSLRVGRHTSTEPPAPRQIGWQDRWSMHTAGTLLNRYVHLEPTAYILLAILPQFQFLLLVLD